MVLATTIDRSTVDALPKFIGSTLAIISFLIRHRLLACRCPHHVRAALRKVGPSCLAPNPRGTDTVLDSFFLVGQTERMTAMRVFLSSLHHLAIACATGLALVIAHPIALAPSATVGLAQSASVSSEFRLA